MDYRSVGSSALRALDSDPPSHTLRAASLLRAGAAHYPPAQGPQLSAGLAYPFGTEVGVGRGLVPALKTGRGASPPAAAEFVRAYHNTSRGWRAGQARRSALDGVVRHLAALIHAASAPDLAFAFAAVQDRPVWIAAPSGVYAYGLHVARGPLPPRDVACHLIGLIRQLPSALHGSSSRPATRSTCRTPCRCD